MGTYLEVFPCLNIVGTHNHSGETIGGSDLARHLGSNGISNHGLGQQNTCDTNDCCKQGTHLWPILGLLEVVADVTLPECAVTEILVRAKLASQQA